MQSGLITQIPRRIWLGQSWQKVVAEISRLLIGVVFIFSGIVKAIDPVGGTIKIGDYLMALVLPVAVFF